MTAPDARPDAPPHPFVDEADAPKPPTPSRRARQLLQLAHQAVYRLPDTFPGFTAAVVASSQQWTVRGAVDVHCPHGAVFRVDPDDPGHDGTGGEPPAAAVTTVTTMILELVSWQFPRRFDELDGRYEAGFRPDLDAPGRRAVQLLGESRRTIRWLDDQGVVATAYRLAGVAHHLDVRSRASLDDGRWLPSSVLEVRRAEGVPDIAHEHVDTFDHIDGVHLPVRRVASRVEVGEVTIDLRDHRPHH
jgi:hypothetical protein